jgi:hypothetical protein
VAATPTAAGLSRQTILSRDTEWVRAGDYSQQVPVTSQDEVGTLQDGFNLMIRGLDERERSVIPLAGWTIAAFGCNIRIPRVCSTTLPQHIVLTASGEVWHVRE